MYCSHEVAKSLVKLQIEQELDALTFVPAVAELLKKWDGKQLSKRFEKALREVNPRLFYQVRNGSFYISVWAKMDHVDEEKSSGISLTHFIPDRYTALLRADMVDITGNGNSATVEGKINADHLIDCLTRWTEQTRESCKKSADKLEHIDELIAEHDRLLKEIEDYSRNLDGRILSAFDLSIIVRRY